MLSLETIHSKLSKRFEAEKISSLGSIPHPFELPNVQEASKLIQEAIQNNKHILIVGDYDADGILSTALMILFFRSLKYPYFSFVIPNRFKDGYGISIPLLERFPEAELIITVDNGITALEVAEYCKREQKTLIITDHHMPKDELPNAIIINPKVSGFVQEDICGCLVAWYFCAGIKAELEVDFNLTPLFELVGIAIVSDMMPLLDLNRIILKKAISLFKSPHFAFSSLLLREYKKIDEECIGFYIAPLINASGRMAQAEIALSFVLSQTQEEAREHFEALKALNAQRKVIQNQIFENIDNHLMITSSCVVAYGEDWHEGVLGILSSKLAELHQKPSFVLTLKNGIYQGSGRSFGEIDLIASLSKLQCLEEFGGHKGAVGLKLKASSLQDFAQNFQPIFDTTKEEEEDFGTLNPALLTQDLLSLLDSFAPYGEGNPKPIFSLPPLPILSQQRIGKDKNHTLLTLQTPFGKPIKAIAFFRTDLKLDFKLLKFHITQDTFTHSPMLLIQS